VLRAGIGTGHAVVGATASALEGITAIYHTLAGDREVTQSVVLLLYSCIRHGSHPKSKSNWLKPYRLNRMWDTHLDLCWGRHS